MGAYRLRGGNDQLPAAFADGLRDLRLLAPARSVQLHPGGIRVGLRGGERIAARYCVLTAPLPAVRKLIEFSPDLPRPLREAVARLRYGVATKVMVQYSRRFWRARDESGRIASDLTFQTTWEATGGQPGREGILVAYAAGKAGALLAGRYSTTRLLLTADEIDDVYPGSRMLYDGGAAAAWLNEMPSLGSVAAYAPGQVTRYWRALRQPVGRLYLAGEHTDSYSGTMEGAVRSGRRVAAKLDARL